MEGGQDGRHFGGSRSLRKYYLHKILESYYDHNVKAIHRDKDKVVGGKDYIMTKANTIKTWELA
jgi:hypothetical protein